MSSTGPELRRWWHKDLACIEGMGERTFYGAANITDTIFACSVENSQLSRADKRVWKRIWWTLFTRDRSVATAMGRPTGINTDDSDVEMLTEDDFIEDDVDGPAEYLPDSVNVQFFLQYVKLCEIMGLVLSQQYSVGSKAKRLNAMDLTHADMALADWLRNCPKEVTWQKSRHHFLAALLHANY